MCMCCPQGDRKIEFVHTTEGELRFNEELQPLWVLNTSLNAGRPLLLAACIVIWRVYPTIRKLSGSNQAQIPDFDENTLCEMSMEPKHATVSVFVLRPMCGPNDMLPTTMRHSTSAWFTKRMGMTCELASTMCIKHFSGYALHYKPAVWEMLLIPPRLERALSMKRVVCTCRSVKFSLLLQFYTLPVHRLIASVLHCELHLSLYLGTLDHMCVMSPDAMGVLAQYYGLPTISMRNALWLKQRDAEPGFGLEMRMVCTSVLSIPRLQDAIWSFY